MLPVNYAGVLLLMLGILMLILEIKVVSFGLLTIGGVISLLLGSLMLIDSPSPELQLNFSLILPVLAGFIVITVFLVRLAVSAQRQAPFTGQQGMLRQVGTTLTAIAAGETGQVSAHGEIWSARAEESVGAHARVRIVGVDGLTLIVRNE